MKLTSRRGSRRATALWAALRIGLGVAALKKPRLASQAWVGTDASRGLTPVVLGRAAGGRDVALGAGAVACALTGAPLTPWVLAGGGADAVDAVATWLGGPELPRSRRILVTAVSAGSALTAVFLATQVDRRPSRLLRAGRRLIRARAPVAEPGESLPGEQTPPSVPPLGLLVGRQAVSGNRRCRTPRCAR